MVASIRAPPDDDQGRPRCSWNRSSASIVSSTWCGAERRPPWLRYRATPKPTPPTAVHTGSPPERRRDRRRRHDLGRRILRRPGPTSRPPAGAVAVADVDDVVGRCARFTSELEERTKPPPSPQTAASTDVWGPLLLVLVRSRIAMPAECAHCRQGWPAPRRGPLSAHYSGQPR